MSNHGAQGLPRGGVAGEARRCGEQREVGGTFPDELGHAFNEELAELLRGEFGRLFHERLPLGFDLSSVLTNKSGGDGALVGKVVIERTDGGTATLGDGGHGGGLKACFDEKVGSRVEEAGEAARGALLLRLRANAG